MRELTLLSLFDGSGGFPLAASMCGIRPVACSEVEPYPIAVTKSRFPNMKHLGSVTDVHGGEVEPVDIITFGSPCQDLSVAGKRAGLKHEANGDDETTRSGLFMEAVRIIKEMREATNGEYPIFAVWENVPGAFSSNKGEDFRTVLEELIKIVEPTAVMPAVPKNGWSYSDSYCGDGWSLAYRVFDAQYWGVPQRRRRIYLVLDLRGQRAGKVSFEREGVRGYFETFKTAGKGTSGDVANRAGADDCEGECVGVLASSAENAETTDGKISPCLMARAGTGGNQLPLVAVPYTLKIRSGCDEGGKGARADDYQRKCDGFPLGFRPENIRIYEETATTICNGTRPGFCNGVIICYDAIGNGDGQTVSTLTGDHENRITDYTSVVCMATQQGGAEIMENLCPTITASAGMSGNNQPVVCGPAAAFKTYQKVTGPLMANSHPGSYTGQDAFSDMLVAGVDCRNGTEYPEMTGTLQAKPNGGFSLNCNQVVRVQYIVRRLTPTECARLQGFPDDWGHPDHKDDFTDEEYRFWLDVRNTHAAINGKPQKDYTKAQMLTWYNKLHTDSAEYKMYGNGIALPCALYVMQGIEEALIHDGMEIDNRIRK